MQGFLKSKIAEKLSTHLDKLKKESSEVWERLVLKHQITIKNVLGKDI